MRAISVTYREAIPARVGVVGAMAGLVGGMGMALWTMVDSALTQQGFWTPLNVCMASFVWRSQAQMMERMLMMHPMTSMAEPLQAGHLIVGAILHLTFSAIVGVAFAYVLYLLARSGLGLLNTGPGYVAGAVAGASILYFGMMYLVLPWANPLMCHFTPRGPFFVGHIVYGAVFGMLAYPLLAHREVVND